MNSCSLRRRFFWSCDLRDPSEMGGKRVVLSARVNSDNPDAVKPVLERIFPKASIKAEGQEFVVKGELEGDDVKELNRSVLSELRRAEKRTRLRAEWTSCDGTTYRFFDYVLKKTSKN